MATQIVKMQDQASFPATAQPRSFASYFSRTGNKGGVQIEAVPSSGPGYIKRFFSKLACGPCAGSDLLSAHDKTRETAQKNVKEYASDPVKQEQLLTGIKNLLMSDDAQLEAMRLDGVIPNLVAKDSSYRPLLIALGATEEMLDTLESNNGDLDSLLVTGKDGKVETTVQGQFLKAVVVLALETNALSSQGFELCSRIYHSLVAVGGDVVQDALVDEELVETFNSSLLRKPDYRIELSKAIATQIRKNSPNLVKGRKVSSQTGMNRALQTYLKDLDMMMTYKLRQDLVDQYMAKGCLTESEAWTEANKEVSDLSDQLITDSLLTHGLEAPSIVMCLAQLVTTHDDFQPNFDPEGDEEESAPTRMYREMCEVMPVLCDLVICPEVITDDENVALNTADFAVSRAYHASAMHSAHWRPNACYGLKANIVRAQAVLYSFGMRVDMNSLMNRVIQQATQNAGSVSAAATLDNLCEYGVIESDGKGGYRIPEGMDLNDYDGDAGNRIDAIQTLAEGLKTDDDLMLLFRSLVIEGDQAEPELLDNPQDDAEVLAENERREDTIQYIRNAAQAADVLERMLDLKHHKAIFGVRMERGIAKLEAQKVTRNMPQPEDQDMDIDEEDPDHLADDPQMETSDSDNPANDQTPTPEKAPETLEEYMAAFNKLPSARERTEEQNKLHAEYLHAIKALKTADRASKSAKKESARTTGKTGSGSKKPTAAEKAQAELIRLRKTARDARKELNTRQTENEDLRSQLAAAQRRISTLNKQVKQGATGGSPAKPKKATPEVTPKKKPTTPKQTPVQDPTPAQTPRRSGRLSGSTPTPVPTPTPTPTPVPTPVPSKPSSVNGDPAPASQPKRNQRPMSGAQKAMEQQLLQQLRQQRRAENEQNRIGSFFPGERVPTEAGVIMTRSKLKS